MGSTMKNADLDIAKRIKKLLKHYDITPYRLAKDVGLGHASVSQFLAGKYLPAYKKLVKIYLYFPEVNPHWFLTGMGEMLEKKSK